MDCKHCRSFIPTWNKFTAEYSHVIHIGQVDCSNEDNHELCLQFKIKAHPSIIYFRDDKYYRYEGKRTLKKLEEFVFQIGYL